MKTIANNFIFQSEVKGTDVLNCIVDVIFKLIKQNFDENEAIRSSKRNVIFIQSLINLQDCGSDQVMTFYICDLKFPSEIFLKK